MIADPFRGCSGSFASTFDDGTGVPALDFEGVIEDSFDMFSQTVPTVFGQSYTLSFLFTNGTDSSAPSELVVSAGDAASAVPDPSAAPEPSTLVISSILFVMCGGVWVCSGRMRNLRSPH